VGKALATLLLRVDLCIVHGGFHELPAESAVLLARQDVPQVNPSFQQARRRSSVPPCPMKQGCRYSSELLKLAAGAMSDLLQVLLCCMGAPQFLLLLGSTQKCAVLQ
jgi:hypothetical protein